MSLLESPTTTGRALRIHMHKKLIYLTFVDLNTLKSGYAERNRIVLQFTMAEKTCGIDMCLTSITDY